MRWRLFCWEMSLDFSSVHLWGGNNIGVLPDLIRPWIPPALPFWEVCSSLLSRILLPSPFSLLTCFPFPAPAVYGNSDADAGHSDHPWREKQRSPERHAGPAHGYSGPGHRSGDGDEHRLCHKPLSGPAPQGLHGNCRLGNGRLHVSDLFCFYTAQLTRRGDKPKIKWSWSLFLWTKWWYRCRVLSPFSESSSCA